MSDSQRYQANWVNTLTGRKPTLNGFEISNGQFEPMYAEEGGQITPDQSKYNKAINWFKHMIPGFSKAAQKKTYQPPKRQLTPVSIDPRNAHSIQSYPLQAQNLIGKQMDIRNNLQSIYKQQ